jgi:PKD repeat protein
VVVRLETSVNGTVQDFGRLSARTVVTGTDGRATAVYTAPSSSPLQGGSGILVTIVATPNGTNAQGLVVRTADLRLVPPGVILPPAETPTPAFSFSSPATAGLSIAFDASATCAGALTDGTCLSSSAVSSYAWNFGDGTTGSGRVVNHAYGVPGNYTVTLTVTNDRGLAASISKTVTVSSAPAASGDWISSPASPAVNQQINFNAQTVIPPPGRTLTSYVWNFGDGTAQATGVQTTHTYTTAATYVVVLTVTDDTGQQTVKSHNLAIGSGSPTPVFTSSVSNATTHTVDFDGSSTTAQGGATVSTYSWAFGDGQSGTGQTVSHSYAAAGTFTVRLTVTDSLGRTGTTTSSVTVP